jgi:hypothetical protein
MWVRLPLGLFKMFPEDISIDTAAKLYVLLWDGIKSRNIECDDWQFRELYEDALEVYRIAISGGYTLETVSDRLEQYLDSCAGNILPYGRSPCAGMFLRKRC